MVYNKVTVAVAAFIMLSVSFFVVAEVSDESDAATLGTYDQKINVYYYDGAWQASVQSSYNLYEAIKATALAVTTPVLTPTVATGNDSWLSGYDPNRSYGLITAINGSADFSIMVWSGSAWVDYTNVPLGWIRPHADYGDTVIVPGAPFSASANVAILVGNQTISGLPTSVSQGLQALQAVENNNNTLYYFTLKDEVGTLTFTNKTVQVFNPATAEMGTSTFDATGIQGTNMIIAAGYGADAYLALIDALGTNLVSDNVSSGKILAWVEHEVYAEDEYQYSYYTYYSWMVTVFGIGTSYDSATQTYSYWGSYSGTYLQYSFGYYSQLSGAYVDQGNAFQLKYVST